MDESSAKTPHYEYDFSLDFKSQVDTAEERVHKHTATKSEAIQIYITERNSPSLLPNPLYNQGVYDLCMAIKTHKHKASTLTPSLDPRTRISQTFGFQALNRSCYILQSLILTRIQKILDEPFSSEELLKSYTGLLEKIRKETPDRSTVEPGHSTYHSKRETTSQAAQLDNLEMEFAQEVQNIWRQFDILQPTVSKHQTVNVSTIGKGCLPQSMFDHPEAPEICTLLTQFKENSESDVLQIPEDTVVSMSYKFVNSAVQAGYVNLV